MSRVWQKVLLNRPEPVTQSNELLVPDWVSLKQADLPHHLGLNGDAAGIDFQPLPSDPSDPTALSRVGPHFDQ